MATKKELKILALLAVVIAVASVGQFGVAGLEFLKGETWMPFIFVRTLLTLFFWGSVVLVFYAIYKYFKI